MSIEIQAGRRAAGAVRGEGYAGAVGEPRARPATDALCVPQSVVQQFKGRYEQFDGRWAVGLTASILRDGRLGTQTTDGRLLALLAHGYLQLVVHSSGPGWWQTYSPHTGTIHLPYGDFAFHDLGSERTSGTWWFFPATPQDVVFWLFLWGGGEWLPFDRRWIIPHCVDGNGALRLPVPLYARGGSPSRVTAHIHSREDSAHELR